jgi:hypothetical protein
MKKIALSQYLTKICQGVLSLVRQILLKIITEANQTLGKSKYWKFID